MLDQIKMTLRGNSSELDVYIDVVDNSLSRKWLAALNNLISKDYHLEKNYCFMGFAQGSRNGAYLIEQINATITAINAADIGYHINDHFALNAVLDGDRRLRHDRFNRLHRYFEDLQGWSGGISNHYQQANGETRWHIRQLNLLCHELEGLILSQRKDVESPEWKRPSQLMCWLNAPRFALEESDYELFGVDTISRKLGGVYVGVNKAVGKHHWEVFNDEGRDSRIAELVTTGLRAQTEASGDFDIEWARDPGQYHWQQEKLKEFRDWLRANGFDPEEKALTIGHPQVAQVDLERSFGTQDYQVIWQKLAQHLDVHKIQTADAEATYEYRWSDPDYAEQQIRKLS